MLPFNVQQYSMFLHQLPTHQRCPVCVGRGTNTRGSLCSRCNGTGEIAIVQTVKLEADTPKVYSARERLMRRNAAKS